MRRVYIETSVWSMLAPGQNPTLQQPTLEFLGHCASRVHDPYISVVVADEIGQAQLDVQNEILTYLGQIGPRVLAMTGEVEALASRFINDGVLPSRRLDDARHVACALVHGLDLLVSWNYRHIANVRKAETFNAIAVLTGLKGDLGIHTPLEVLEWL